VADTRANTRVNIRGYGPETRGWSEGSRGRDFLRRLETDTRVIRKASLLAPARDSVRDESLAWLDFLMLISVPFGRYFRLALSRE